MLFVAVMMMLAEPAPDCTPIEKEIIGDSLEGQLFADQKVHAVSLACRTPKKFDFIIFKSSGSDNLVIKQVWGVPGDRLTVSDRGRIYINGEQTLTPFDKPYSVKPFYRKRLKKLEGPLEGYMALGHPGSLDSGRVGPIPAADVVGVVSQEEGRERP